jgi:hypothetical protein
MGQSINHSGTLAFLDEKIVVKVSLKTYSMKEPSNLPTYTIRHQSKCIEEYNDEHGT